MSQATIVCAPTCYGSGIPIVPVTQRDVALATKALRRFARRRSVAAE